MTERGHEREMCPAGKLELLMRVHFCVVHAIEPCGQSVIWAGVTLVRQGASCVLTSDSQSGSSRKSSVRLAPGVAVTLFLHRQTFTTGGDSVVSVSRRVMA